MNSLNRDREDEKPNILEGLYYWYLAYKQRKHIKNMKCEFGGCKKRYKYRGFDWYLCSEHLLVVYGVKPYRAKELLKILNQKWIPNK